MGGESGDARGGKGEERPGMPAEPVESFSATGIDNALDLLEVVTAKMDKASVGSKAAEIERHPEVRLILDSFSWE